MIRPSLHRIEQLTAITLTLAAVGMHLLNYASAGALWRDEANTVGLATLPAMADVWGRLEFDSFPITWHFIVRGIVTAFGSMNDPALRMTGLVAGLLGIAAVWTIRSHRSNSAPLMALALFTIHPSVIRWGDSLRAYGLGMALAIVTVVAFGRLASSGGRRNFAVALILAVIGVNTIYYNAVVVFACCAGGAVACVVHGRLWRRALAIAGAGSLAALSLLPYTRMITATSSWNASVQIPDFGISWFLTKLAETLAPAGLLSFAVWLGIVPLAIWAGLRESAAGARLQLDAEQRRLAMFASITLAVGVAAHFLFLRALSYVTQPWYYLSLLASSAVCIEMLSGALIRNPKLRVVRLLALLPLSILTLASGTRLVRERMTNVDVIADKLEAASTPRDLIVIYPWYTGITFVRYYTGNTPWLTLPVIGPDRFHRYDILVEQMTKTDQRAPIIPIIAEASRVLRGGGTVYVAGPLPPRSTSLMAPAKMPADGWLSPEYEKQWGAVFADYLLRHAREFRAVPVRNSKRVSHYERLDLTAATGWRE